MKKFMLNTLTLGICLTAAALPVASASAADGDLGGNRYYYTSYYAGEISAARAFVDAVVKNGKWTDRSDKLTILDVRDATEYKRGHPEGAYHVPYPRVYQECKPNLNDPTDMVLRPEDGGACLYGRSGLPYTTTPEDFFLAVEAMFPDKSQRLALLCRTGSRSVRGSNILANPAGMICPANDEDCQETYAGRGYSRVFNIWQGFVGQPMAPFSSPERTLGPSPADVTDVTLEDGSPAAAFVAFQLDLNNDGVLGDEDLDGWRGHQDLPYDTRMLPKLLSDDAMPYYDLP